VQTPVAKASRAALLPVTGDAVTDLAKAGELLDLYVDQISRMLLLVALQRRFGLEIRNSPRPRRLSTLVTNQGN
jgi:hypothetical protein